MKGRPVGTKTIRICDVYGTASADIRLYEVTFKQVDPAESSKAIDTPCLSADKALIVIRRELCPRARRRAEALIRKATSPPQRKKAPQSPKEN